MIHDYKKESVSPTDSGVYYLNKAISQILNTHFSSSRWMLQLLVYQMSLTINVLRSHAPQAHKVLLSPFQLASLLYREGRIFLSPNIQGLWHSILPPFSYMLSSRYSSLETVRLRDCLFRNFFENKIKTTTTFIKLFLMKMR